MAHFAQLDENNIVTNVIVVHNNELMDGTDESEAKGIKFCKDHYGQDTVWVQTSYNGNFRKRYAGQGYTYDSARDAFITPQPFPSWTLDEITLDWVPPVPMPTDAIYRWDEETQTWIKVADFPVPPTE